MTTMERFLWPCTLRPLTTADGELDVAHDAVVAPTSWRLWRAGRRTLTSGP
jgi:hypothetical protein